MRLIPIQTNLLLPPDEAEAEAACHHAATRKTTMRRTIPTISSNKQVCTTIFHRQRWAVDTDESACQSLKLNHPETQIRNESAEDFLDLLKEWDKLCKHYSIKAVKAHDQDSRLTRSAEKDVYSKTEIKAATSTVNGVLATIDDSLSRRNLEADSGKLGDSDCSPILRSLEMELDHEEHLGQVPDASWAVPEIPSPPTASGLSWPMNVDHYMETTTAFVPDVCYSSWPNLYPTELNGSSLKRRRQYY